MVRSIKSVFIFLGLFITLFLYQNCAPTFQSSNLILNEEGFPSELNPLINDAPLLKTESKLLMNTLWKMVLMPATTNPS